jgi:predicted alpha/beta hydrolase family esterase
MVLAFQTRTGINGTFFICKFVYEKPVILFIQGGAKGAYKADKKLASFLQEALEDTYVINYPRMPDENNPDYENHKAKIDEELRKIDTKMILVGHSLGSCFLLKYLSENKTDKEITGIFLIAAPFWGGDGWQHEGFRLENDLASKLPAKAPIFFYHSTDDETVPFAHLALYAKKYLELKSAKLSDAGINWIMIYQRLLGI